MRNIYFMGIISTYAILNSALGQDDCGLGYCPDCESENLVTCQFCSDNFCESSWCNYLDVCRGEGCNRANCPDGECFDDNEQSVNRVRKYKYETEKAKGIISFCGDCWEKNREEIEEGDA